MARDLQELIEQIDGLGDHILDESLRRIRRRSPVDTGKYRRSHFKGDDGIYSDDIPEKIEAIERGISDFAPDGVYRVTVAEIPDMVRAYMRDPSIARNTRSNKSRTFRKRGQGRR